MLEPGAASRAHFDPPIMLDSPLDSGVDILVIGTMLMSIYENFLLCLGEMRSPAQKSEVRLRER